MAELRRIPLSDPLDPLSLSGTQQGIHLYTAFVEGVLADDEEVTQTEMNQIEQARQKHGVSKAESEVVLVSQRDSHSTIQRLLWRMKTSH